MQKSRFNTVLASAAAGVMAAIGFGGKSEGKPNAYRQRDHTFAGYTEEEIRAHTKMMAERKAKHSLRNSVKPGCRLFNIDGKNVMALNQKNAERKAKAA